MSFIIFMLNHTFISDTHLITIRASPICLLFKRWLPLSLRSPRRTMLHKNHNIISIHMSSLNLRIVILVNSEPLIRIELISTLYERAILTIEIKRQKMVWKVGFEPTILLCPREAGWPNCPTSSYFKQILYVRKI